MLTSWGRASLAFTIQFEVLSLVSDFKCNLDVLCSQIRILLEPLFQLLSLLAFLGLRGDLGSLRCGVHVWAPGLHWHCRGMGPPAPPQQGGGKYLGATGWGRWSRLPPLLPDCTASQAGGEGPSQPRGPGTPGPPPRIPAGWGGWVCWRGAVQSVSLLLPVPLLAPWPERQFCWEFGLPHWCFQVAGVFSSKSGVAMGTHSHTIPRVPAALPSSPLPLCPSLSRAVLCCALGSGGFQVGLKGGDGSASTDLPPT